MILASLWLASVLSVTPVHGHWPEVGIVNTTCENVLLVLSKEEPSEIYYNSVAGVVVHTYHYADGTILDVYYYVDTLAHEEAADYAIKVIPTPFMYREQYKIINHLWVDEGGKGECRDFRLQPRTE